MNIIRKQLSNFGTKFSANMKDQVVVWLSVDEVLCARFNTTCDIYSQRIKSSNLAKKMKNINEELEKDIAKNTIKANNYLRK